MGEQHTYVYSPVKVRDKRLADLFPHYSDDRFEKEQTIFGAPSPGLSYDYNDRLWEWNGAEKMAQAKEAADATGHEPNSTDWLSAWISHIQGKPLVVEHVVAGVNRGNGYPYFVLGYREAAQ